MRERVCVDMRYGEIVIYTYEDMDRLCDTHTYIHEATSSATCFRRLSGYPYELQTGVIKPSVHRSGPIIAVMQPTAMKMLQPPYA